MMKPNHEAARAMADKYAHPEPNYEQHGYDAQGPVPNLARAYLESRATCDALTDRARELGRERDAALAEVERLREALGRAERERDDARSEASIPLLAALDDRDAARAEAERLRGEVAWSESARGEALLGRDAALQRAEAAERERDEWRAIAGRVVCFWGTEHAQSCQCCDFARGEGHDGGCIVGDCEALLTKGENDDGN